MTSGRVPPQDTASAKGGRAVLHVPCGLEFPLSFNFNKKRVAGQPKCKEPFLSTSPRYFQDSTPSPKSRTRLYCFIVFIFF